MIEYHKIQSLFKRDPHNMRYFLEGQWSLPEFEYLKDLTWVFTEKIDGTNIRVMWDGSNVSFGGKTDNAQLYVPLLNKLKELFDTPEKRELFKELFPKNEEPTQVCLYGEGYGAGIQKGGCYKKDGVDFVLFDIKIGGWWLKREDCEGIAVKLGIKIVPVVAEGTLISAVNIVKSGLKSQWGDFPAEGLVARPMVELRSRNGARIITKIKAKDFKIEETPPINARQ